MSAFVKEEIDCKFDGKHFFFFSYFTVCIIIQVAGTNQAYRNNPANFFKVKNRNIRKRCEICSKYQ